MRILRVDSVGGASGDMILAALIDAGVSVATLRKPLASLPIEAFKLKARRVTRDGHAATQVQVDVPHLHEAAPHHEATLPHGHTHTHADGTTHAHAHEHPHTHEHAADDHHPHGPHRTLRQIRGLLRRSGLTPRVKQLSLAVFQRLAEAEGRVHDKPPDDVHFHEVGAVDSIVDIVGACLALEALGIEGVDVGPLPEGQGTIRCAHGIMPIPVPATADLLQGHPVQLTREPYELVTPTGAALLMTWKALMPVPANSTGTIVRIGSSFGSRTLQHRPNLLRALVIDIPGGDADHVATGQDDCLVLECNLDDTNPEWIGTLTTVLLEAGARDVFTTAVQMKKQRPGTLLTVLCNPTDRDAMIDLLFRESTTFGVRETLTRRTMLERRHVSVKTRFGAVRIKEGRWKGRVVTRSPEHEDCARAAKHHGVALRTVYAAALAG